MGRFLALVLAFALLFAPVSIAQASAGMPSHEPMKAQGWQCIMIQKGSGAHHGTARKACCAGISLAVAAATAGSLAGELLAHEPGIPAVIESQLRFLDEIATPPPRPSGDFLKR
ncbi:MAG TPA: hypothetical protein VGU01_15845 [Sphingomicrobium sp.]|nr:hypothetical protein [Sphingomicrobium sp.]